MDEHRQQIGMNRSCRVSELFITLHRFVDVWAKTVGRLDKFRIIFDPLTNYASSICMGVQFHLVCFMKPYHAAVFSRFSVSCWSSPSAAFLKFDIVSEPQFAKQPFSDGHGSVN